MADVQLDCPGCGESIGVDYNAHDPIPASLTGPADSGGVCDAVVVDKGACKCPDHDEAILIQGVEEYVLTDVVSAYDTEPYDEWLDSQGELVS